MMNRVRSARVAASGRAVLSASRSVSSAQTSIRRLRSSAMPFRNIGPFRPSAWVTSIAVPDAPLHEHLYTMWVGVRSGGVWKTDERRRHVGSGVRQQSASPSIGAVAVAPSNANIVWVGTGDNANARSSYSGRGVYKTIDGGKSWASMGLWTTRITSRASSFIRHNPNIVYVAAMGHLFSTNAERGVFRTLDGGTTWKKVLYIDEHTGAIDLVIDPVNPRRLYAAMFDKQRLPWRLIESGPGSGIFRTTNGGDTWQRARRRTSDRSARPHRSRHLSQESADSLRARRESESASGRPRHHRQ